MENVNIECAIEGILFAAGEPVKAAKLASVPVSYTHLDVYKRQVPFMAIAYIIGALIIVIINIQNVPGVLYCDVLGANYTCLLYTSKVCKYLAKSPKLKFSSIFRRGESKPEMIATFLAVLEMIKLNKIKTEYDDGQKEFILYSV